jgi:ElaB/YqjD/DUF883 family membrane-anchored ribosome-binding protein
MSHSSSETGRTLGEFKEVLASVEEFIHAAASQSGEKLEKARANLERVTRAGREALERAEESGRAAVEATEVSIKEHPWTAVAVSAGVGLLLGLLISRR